jgi:hypothetical protein
MQSRVAEAIFGSNGSHTASLRAWMRTWLKRQILISPREDGYGHQQARLHGKDYLRKSEICGIIRKRRGDSKARTNNKE